MGNVVGGSGGQSFSFACPKGSYVTNIGGRAGSQLDAIGVTCSNGMQSQLYGGTGGNAWSASSPNGFANTQVYADDKVNGVWIQPVGGMGVGYGTQTGGKSASGSCTGGPITGISGSSGSMIDSLGFDCQGTHYGYSDTLWLLLIVAIAAALYMKMTADDSHRSKKKNNRKTNGRGSSLDQLDLD